MMGPFHVLDHLGKTSIKFWNVGKTPPQSVKSVLSVPVVPSSRGIAPDDLVEEVEELRRSRFTPGSSLSTGPK